MYAVTPVDLLYYGQIIALLCVVECDNIEIISVSLGNGGKAIKHSHSTSKIEVRNPV